MLILFLYVLLSPVIALIAPLLFDFKYLRVNSSLSVSKSWLFSVITCILRVGVFFLASRYFGDLTNTSYLLIPLMALLVMLPNVLIISIGFRKQNSVSNQRSELKWNPRKYLLISYVIQLLTIGVSLWAGVSCTQGGGC